VRFFTFIDISVINSYANDLINNNALILIFNVARIIGDNEVRGEEEETYMVCSDNERTSS
jgi:hypothetical protein